jgi:ribosome maturation factor RimP
VEYSPLEKSPWYAESRALVNALGCELLDLKIIRSRGNSRVNVVIAGREPEQGIGIEDCEKVHRALRARLEALTGMDDFSMEVASPGTERVITNAAELPLFAERAARFWDTRSSAWVSGVIKGVTEENVSIRPLDGAEESSERALTTLPLGAIAKAKLL